MNIKGLLGNMVTSPIRNKDGQSKVERTIKSDESHDRDANGQQFYDQNKKQQQGSLSEEQFKKAVEYLEALASVKEHGWTVESIIENEKRFVLVKDNLGTIVRRIPESELWTLPFDKDVRTGQLLKKSA
jgi:uncharacterized FlaG/YvyC family protein